MIIMNKEQRFIATWIIGVGIGWHMAKIMGTVMRKIFFADITIDNAPLFWLVFGVVLGLVQWIILRSWIKGIGFWVIVTALGCYGFSQLSRLLYYLCFTQWFWYLILSGIIIGVFQYIIIRKRFRRAELWILSTAIGWVLTTLLSTSNNPFTIILSGFVFSFFTGIGLALLNQLKLDMTE